MNGKTKAVNVPALTASYKSLITNQQTFVTNNYNSEPDTETRKKGKVVKLFRCFVCEQCFSATTMSGFLIICKNCLASEQIENERSRQRFVKTMLNKIGVFLRRRV